MKFISRDQVNGKPKAHMMHDKHNEYGMPLSNTTCNINAINSYWRDFFFPSALLLIIQYATIIPQK